MSSYFFLIVLSFFVLCFIFPIGGNALFIYLRFINVFCGTSFSPQMSSENHFSPWVCHFHVCKVMWYVNGVFSMLIQLSLSSFHHKMLYFPGYCEKEAAYSAFYYWFSSYALHQCQNILENQFAWLANYKQVSLSFSSMSGCCKKDLLTLLNA